MAHPQSPHSKLRYDSEKIALCEIDTSLANADTFLLEPTGCFDVACIVQIRDDVFICVNLRM